MRPIGRISFRRPWRQLYHAEHALRERLRISSDGLAGKVALVTVGGSGIGRGCALMFARQGGLLSDESRAF
jgi:hypothetical protein